jgi:hypothetical protein
MRFDDRMTLARHFGASLNSMDRARDGCSNQMSPRPIDSSPCICTGGSDRFWRSREIERWRSEWIVAEFYEELVLYPY